MGSGASSGIPVIGCHCPVCQSKDVHNQRLRTCALLKIGEKRIAFDIGPDFRAQALKYHLDHLDGVIITHAHYDHIGGLDDLRAFYFQQQRPIPCLLSKQTYEDIKQRYYYLFEKRGEQSNFTAQFDFHLLPEERGETTFVGMKLRYLTYFQGGMPVTGLRLGSMAYISDIHDYPEAIFEDLKGLDVLVLSALRFTPSHVHFSVDQAVEFAERVGAKQTWLVHMAHELDHQKTNTYLPKHIQLSYDGLEFNFNF
jgi:phosphoribosyl 1,2-cyclic phosphate phosphodiesterase